MKRILKLGILLFYVSVLSDVLGQSGKFNVRSGFAFRRNSQTIESGDSKLISIEQATNTNDSIVLRKFDWNCNQLNFKSYYIGSQTQLPGIYNSIEGDIFMIYSNTFNSFYLHKINRDFQTIWKKVIYGHSGGELKQFSNGNIYISGTAYNYGEEDFSLMKLDSLGNILWNKVYGGNKRDWIKGFYIKNNEIIDVLGYSESDSSGNRRIKKLCSDCEDLVFLKYNSGGVLLEEKNFSEERYRLISNSCILTKDSGYLVDIIFDSIVSNVIYPYYYLVKLDKTFNFEWRKQYFDYGSIIFENSLHGELYSHLHFDSLEVIKIDSKGNKLWSQNFPWRIDGNQWPRINNLIFRNEKLILSSRNNLLNEIQVGNNISDSSFLLLLEVSFKKIKGRVFPDFNSNCTFNKPTEYNIPNVLIRNRAENTYAITNDSNYTIHIFEKDTAVLEVVNLDGSLYTSCGKNSITLNMSSNNDTSGVDFPIRSNKSGHCINITSFSSGLLRPGRWGDYQLNFQNNAFDTAYNAYIEIELDMSTIDSIASPYAFSQIGNILRFNLGHIKPFDFGTISYSIKLKTSVVIGSSQCHRAKVFPHCSLYPSNGYDGSDIKASVKCLGNNTIELELENSGSQNQTQSGKLAIYQDESLLKQDSFKMDKGTLSKFQYQLDDNKVFTAEVYSSNAHPVTPILIRHQDLCANKRPFISNNPVVNFYRHDEAKEYEESCQIVQGSYDPNVKSVQPSGFLSEHYTANGTELKYRIDFQNTGTDTAFRVVLIDTLSSLLNIATFMPGVSSHPYSVEFGGRAIKFIFDPIALVDSFKNEPLSHGFVHFKIKPIAGISPKTKIENNADIYFDYNAPIRTNTVFNTIFDTIQIYVPKGGSAIVENDKTSVILFPNPTTDKFFIQMSEPVVDLSIEIYDMQGRMIKTVSSTNNQTIEVSAQGMTKGIYHIRCMSGEKLIVVKKVMVE